MRGRHLQERVFSEKAADSLKWLEIGQSIWKLHRNEPTSSEGQKSGSIFSRSRDSPRRNTRIYSDKYIIYVRVNGQSADRPSPTRGCDQGLQLARVELRLGTAVRVPCTVIASNNCFPGLGGSRGNARTARGSLEPPRTYPPATQGAGNHPPASRWPPPSGHSRSARAASVLLHHVHASET